MSMVCGNMYDMVDIIENAITDYSMRKGVKPREIPFSVFELSIHISKYIEQNVDVKEELTVGIDINYWRFIISVGVLIFFSCMLVLLILQIMGVL